MRRSFAGVLTLAVASLASVVDARADTCSSVEMTAPSGADNSISFVFDGDYECGQFANGDWWVVPNGSGTVTITEITPAATQDHHGWAVNPASTDEQPFDARVDSHDNSLQPALPYDASPESSVVKTVSLDLNDGGCRPCLQFAAVLTVLDKAPDAPEATFRPPYFGDQKPLYRSDALKLSHLPALDSSCCDGPSIEEVRSDFRHVQLDHKSGWNGRHMHPADNLPDYGSDIARRTAVSALRMMLDDFDPSKPDHRQALINYLQAGIDYHGMVQGGMDWPPDGGHSNGRKLPVLAAALLLDDSAIMASAKKEVYSEDTQVYHSSKADDGNGKALFGKPCSEEGYWSRLRSGSGSKDCRDPYGYIDGGSESIGAYLGCCNWNPWQYTALAVRLMDGAEPWTADPLLNLVDRMENHGLWSKPDPCAPYDGNPDNYGKTYGPDGNGGCIKGEGRFTDRHGDQISNHYGSGFGESMWDEFRDCIPNCDGQGARSDEGSDDGGDTASDTGPNVSDAGSDTASKGNDSGTTTGDLLEDAEDDDLGSEPPAGDDSGCNCSAPGERGPSGSWLGIVVGMAILGLRRMKG